MDGEPVHTESAKNAIGGGHSTNQCRGSSYQKGPSGYPRRIYTVDGNGQWSEEAATIAIEIAGVTTRALLDTGARISVMDMKSMNRLGLQHKLVATGGQVYGICNSPVSVIGYVEAQINVSGDKNPVERIQVLRGDEQTLLLGRQFMQKFDRVVFDWNSGVVELGRTKLPIFARATGGDPLERARVVRSSLEEAKTASQHREVINCDLPWMQRQAINKLIGEYKSTFDERPGKTETCEHAIYVGDDVPTTPMGRRD